MDICVGGRREGVRVVELSAAGEFAEDDRMRLYTTRESHNATIRSLAHSLTYSFTINQFGLSARRESWPPQFRPAKALHSPHFVDSALDSVRALGT